MLAHLRGIKLPSTSTGLRGRRARSVVLQAMEYEIMAENRRQGALILAVISGRLEAGAAKKAIRDSFHELDMAGYLSAFRLDEAKEATASRSTVKVERLYDALAKGGLIGKAEIAETD